MDLDSDLQIQVFLETEWLGKEGVNKNRQTLILLAATESCSEVCSSYFSSQIRLWFYNPCFGGSINKI